MSITDTAEPVQAAAPASNAAKPATPFVYTPADQDAVRRIDAWLNTNNQQRSWLARKARLSSSTLSQVLNGKYPSSPTAFLTDMQAVLEVETERLGDGTPGYIEGSVHKLAFVVCDRMRKHANFGVLVGHVGVGKTRTLKEYRDRRPQTVLIESAPKMTEGVLLIDLLQQINAPVPPGLDAKFQAAVKALSGTNYLLLVDEAETVTSQCLHYLRRIHDKAGVGVVLAGTPKLHELLKVEHGQFDQIRSRVSMWPATIKTITRDDMDEMARVTLGRGTEVTDEVLDVLWDYSAGSARVLTKVLVPALRDYAGGRALTPKLVDSIAETVLFMKRHHVAGGKGA